MIEKPTGTKYCAPDPGTKNHGRKRRQLLLGLMGFVSLDSGLLAGQHQLQEMTVVNGFKKGFSSTSALRAVISMLMIQPSSGLLIGDTSDAESVMVSFMWAMMGIFVCVMVLMMLMVVMKSRFVKFGVVVGALAWGMTTTMAMGPDPEPSENHEEGQRGRAYGEPEVEESDPTAGSSSGQATTSSHAHQESAASSSTGTYQQEAASTYEAVPTDYVGDEGSADVDIVYRLGGGGSYHRFGCGMVRRFWKDKPLRVRRLSRSFAQTETYLKPCKQCNPDS